MPPICWVWRNPPNYMFYRKEFCPNFLPFFYWCDCKLETPSKCSAPGKQKRKRFPTIPSSAASWIKTPKLWHETWKMAVSKRNLLFQGVIFQGSCIEKVAGIGLLEAWSQRNFLSSSNGPQMVLSSRAIVELGQVQHINLYQLPTNCRLPNPENPDIQHYPPRN